MKQDLLKKFLVELPTRLDYDNAESIKDGLFKAFYYAATNDGEFLHTLFPDITDGELLELKDYHFSIPRNEHRRPEDDDQNQHHPENSFYHNLDNDNYNHPKGTACARPLKRGEPVYRCDDCGFDATCVLCVFCFNENDHVGHSVQMYIASESSSGVCDCGDPEAFPETLNCKCQTRDAHEDQTDEMALEDSIDPHFKQAIKVTIRVILDYVLDVTNFSISPLPFIHDNINKGHNLLNSEALSNISSLSLKKYGATDINSNDKWHLILWNDENHNFPEATNAISSATGVDHLRAHQIASHINLNGRCVLKSSSSPFALYKSLDKVESGGLVATIMSARDYVREEMCHHMLHWLNDILSFNSNPDFRDVCRTLLGDLLLEPNFTFSKTLPTSLIDDFSINVKRRCFENGLLYQDQLVNMGLSKLRPGITAKDLNSSTHLILEPPADGSFDNSRIQFLLLFSIRFKSSVRKLLSQIYIPSALTDSSRKAIFCKQYVQIYPQLLTSLALADREEKLTCLSEIGAQIMTCPTSVKYILENNQIGNILSPLAQLIEEHAGKWNYDTGYPNFHEPLTSDPLSNRPLYEAIARGMQDVHHIVDRNFCPQQLYRVLTPENLSMLLLLLRNFQGYWPVERKYGDHVEREILDFVIHLKYSVPVLKIAKQIAEADCEDPQIVRLAVQWIIDYLLCRKIEQKAPGIADFKVSKDPVSFVHPINSLLSFLLQNYDFSLFEDIFKNLNPPIMTISDVSLRSVVLGSQVKVGFWIRNGISVSRQASLYTGTVMADLAYWRDLHLNQLAALLDDPTTTLYNFLDRWELLDWFTGKVEYKNTVYEDRFSSMAEKFILFVYNLITDRFNFIPMTNEERMAKLTRQAICYALSEGPKAYSFLKDSLDIELMNFPDFDVILKEVADYKPPTGLMDTGMYRLKEQCYSELDPYSLHLDSSQSQDVQDAIIKFTAKSTNQSEDKVHLEPKIILSSNDFVNQKMAGFTKTNSFAKLLYKFLQVSIDNKDETYLSHALHLFHAVLVDEHILNGRYVVPECFVNIPISDLLMNLAESTMSKPITVKASYLLTLLIDNEERVIESLVDCFGKDHIDRYLARKSSPFESETEKRKRLAEERNAKVMKKFAKQRKKFLDHNDDYTFDKQNDTVDDNVQIGRRNCVLCGEQESNDEVFGILSSTITTPILWKVPDNNPVLFRRAFDLWEFYDESESYDGYYDAGYPLRSAQKSHINNGKFNAQVATTCGHGMHYSCYKRSTGRNNHFSCPLCHTIHNIFIPSFLPPSGNNGLGDDQLYYDPIKNKHNLITHSSNENKTMTLLESFVNDGWLEQSLLLLQKNLEVFNEDFNHKLKNDEYLSGSSKRIDYFNILQRLSTIIADTIRMTEITCRLDGIDSYHTFLNAVPSSTKTLLKSLIQCRAVLFHLRDLPSLSGSDNDLSQEIENFWESDYLVDGAFNELVMLFFQTDESFITLSRLAFTKLVTVNFFSLSWRCLSKENYSQTYRQGTGPVPESVVDDLSHIYERGRDAFSDLFTKSESQQRDFFKTIYCLLQLTVIPFLRQLLMFKDILSSTNEGDNVHAKFDDSDLIKEVFATDDNELLLDNPDTFCKLFQLPTLQQLILTMANGNESMFEYKIYDIMVQAKIPNYLDAGILTLDFPGMIKLIDIPVDYMSCVMKLSANNTGGLYDAYICLHCRLRTSPNKFYRHMRKCSSHTCVFFHPVKNNFRVVTHIGGGSVSLLLPGPYLTEHGEVKEPRSTGTATLNVFRYLHLNKMWLNQGLYSLITRTLYGSRQNNGIPTNNFNFTVPGTTTLEESSEEEEEEDDDYFYSPFAW